MEVGDAVEHQALHGAQLKGLFYHHEIVGSVVIRIHNDVHAQLAQRADGGQQHCVFNPHVRPELS